MISSSANPWRFAPWLYKVYQKLRPAPQAPVEIGTSYTPDTSHEGVRETVRLSPHALAALERRFPPPLLGNDSNDPMYVGQIIGIQRVLKELRDGWTV